MIIAVNATSQQAFTGGTGRYLHKVLAHVRQVQTRARFAILTGQHNHDQFEGWPRVLVHGGGAVFGGRSALDAALKRTNAEAVLSPLETAPARTAVPQVLCCTELAAWHDQQGKPRTSGRGRMRAVRKACANAHGLVVSSEYLKRKCLELFGAPLDRTLIAPPGTEALFEEAQRPIVEPPYLLVLNDSLTRPWAETVGRVFREHTGEFPYTMVVAGADPDESPEAWGPRKVHVERCADTHLAALYQHASLFLYPALHDGAALRVLEGLRAGACVVCPRSGGVPELAGDVPLYYNGASTDSLVQAVRRALDLEPEQRAERVRLGQGHARHYQWKQTAWKLLSAFAHL